MNKLWVIKEQDKPLGEKLAGELGISPLLAQILINRGLNNPAEVEKFLFCKKSFLHNPLHLKDIKKAVGRIKKALKNKEKILIYGDYDVDGITSIAILYTFLRREGGLADWYIPNRLDEGYGLNLKALNSLKSKGISLLIAVDCGTTSRKEIDFLNKHKIDTIIIDHHQVQKESFPDAFCVINPLQPGCSYPFKELASVGLVYKLICAILDDTEHKNEEFLDLVALGTVADVAPQVGENRILTRFGLSRLSDTSRIGLKALMDAAGLYSRHISTEHIGFVIGPRINVGGRIGSPELALKLILSERPDEAKEIAGVLNEENSFRQKLQERILKEAVSKIEGEFNFKDNRVIVVWGEDWHPGVIGIVASKLADRFYRPAIVFNVQDKIAKGSGRSIENFHLFEAVYKCRDVLESFGGHEAACGITVSKDKIERFRDLINIAAQTMLKASDLIPRIDVDMEVPLSSLSRNFIDELRLLEPFGTGNPQPLFLSTNLKVKDLPTQFGRAGMKMWVTDKNMTCEAVCFNALDMLGRTEKSSCVDMVYYPKMRQVSGIESVKLQVEDLKEAKCGI